MALTVITSNLYLPASPNAETITLLRHELICVPATLHTYDTPGRVYEQQLWGSHAKVLLAQIVDALVRRL